VGTGAPGELPGNLDGLPVKRFIAVAGPRRTAEGGVEYLDPWDVALQHGVDPEECAFALDDSEVPVLLAQNPGARVLQPLYQPPEGKRKTGCGC
jgi:hypothetical protein